MKRYCQGAALFVAGCMLGLILGGRTERHATPPNERAAPFTVRRDGEKSVYLVPFAIAENGRTVPVAEKGAGPLWVVQFNSPRVQVAATEEPDPR